MFNAIIILLMISPHIHYSNTIGIDNLITMFNTIQRFESNSLSKSIDACIMYELSHILLFTINTGVLTNNSTKIRRSIAILFKFMNHSRYGKIGYQLFTAYKTIQGHIRTLELSSFVNIIKHIQLHIKLEDAIEWNKTNMGNENVIKICNHIFTVFTDEAALINYMTSLNNATLINTFDFKRYQLTSNIVTFQDENKEVKQLLNEHYKDLLCLYKKFLWIINNFKNHLVYSQLEYLSYIIKMFIHIYDFSNKIIPHIENQTGQPHRREISLLHAEFRLYIIRFISDADLKTIIEKVKNKAYLEYLFVHISYYNDVIDLNTDECKSLQWIYIDYSNCFTKIPNDNAISELEKEFPFSFEEKIHILEHNLSISEYTVKYITDYLIAPSNLRLQ